MSSLKNEFKVGDCVVIVGGDTSSLRGRFGWVRMLAEDGNLGLELANPYKGGGDLGGICAHGYGFFIRSSSVKLAYAVKKLIKSFEGCVPTSALCREMQPL
jgi:hypothetical protein